MTSVIELQGCAKEHLRHYTDPAGPRAFQAYDRLGDPDSLQPGDLFSPALLDAPLRGDHVRLMYGADGPYRVLREALEAVVGDSAAREADFRTQGLNPASAPWDLVRGALRASDETPGIKASKVSKILHRKRPDLVPIFDSRVAGFYGLSPREPWRFWPVVQRDLNENHSWLTELASEARTPDGRLLSGLRALDIVIWEHVITGCRGGSRIGR